MTFKLPEGCFNFGQSFIERNTKGDTTLTLVSYDGSEEIIQNEESKKEPNMDKNEYYKYPWKSCGNYDKYCQHYHDIGLKMQMSCGVNFSDYPCISYPKKACDFCIQVHNESHCEKCEEFEKRTKKSNERFRQLEKIRKE